MNLIHHKNLDLDKWYASSISYQMANVGSEISRFIKWSEKNQEYADLAFERALELIDITVSDKKNKKRLREILRVRELLCEWKYAELFNPGLGQAWMKYFDEFAVMANNQK